MASSAKKVELGRIVFPKNPWPKGHRITKLAWTGRVVPDSGLWFSLHLETAPYDEGGPQGCRGRRGAGRRLEVQDRLAELRALHDVVDQMGRQRISRRDGAPALDLAKLKGRTFLVDPVRRDRDFEQPAPFGLYLLGHDAAAAHRITVGKRTGPQEFDLEWSG